MAPVESLEHKAERILREARLQVGLVDPNTGLIVASCRGFSDGEVYHLGWDPGMREWRCTCRRNRDFHKPCSHLEALWHVVVKPTEVTK